PKLITQSVCNGTRAFVARLATGTLDVLTATYLGGTFSDEAWGIAADDAGNVYVVGDAHSTDLRVNPGKVYQHAVNYSCVNTPGSGNPCDDIFIVKLDPLLMNALYFGYLGNNGIDTGRAIAV